MTELGHFRPSSRGLPIGPLPLSPQERTFRQLPFYEYTPFRLGSARRVLFRMPKSIGCWPHGCRLTGTGQFGAIQAGPPARFGCGRAKSLPMAYQKWYIAMHK